MNSLKLRIKTVKFKMNHIIMVITLTDRMNRDKQSEFRMNYIHDIVVKEIDSRV